MKHFKRQLATFAILHLVFTALLLVTLNFFSALTNELKAYLWWILIVFDVEGTLVQTVIFGLFPKLTRSRTIFLTVALIVELIFLNLFVLLHGNWQEFSNDLLITFTSRSG